MKLKTILLAALPLAMLLSTGCPYETSFPISEPSVALADAGLKGTWTQIGSDKESTVEQLTIVNFNASEYLVQLLTIDKGSYQIQNVRAFPSVISKSKFLNVMEFSDKLKFNYYRYTLAGDTLKVEPVSDKFPGSVEAKSQQELKTYLEKNMNNPKFYEDKMVFVRFKK